MNFTKALRTMLSVLIVLPILLMSACAIPVCCAPEMDVSPTHETTNLSSNR